MVEDAGGDIFWPQGKDTDGVGIHESHQNRNTSYKIQATRYALHSKRYRLHYRTDVKDGGQSVALPVVYETGEGIRIRKNGGGS